jgi:hypothetical protein
MSRQRFAKRHDRTVAVTKLSLLVSVTAMLSAVVSALLLAGLFHAVNG